MRIINNADKKVEFLQVKVGDCFLYDGCLFIKMNPVKKNDHAANAYSFIDNTVACVPQACQVIPVEAEVIIHSKGAE